MLQVGLPTILGGRKFTTPWLDANNQLWYDARYNVSTSGSAITSWDDRKAGRSQPLTVYPAKTGGTFNSNDGDSAPAWRTNGSTDLLYRTSFTPLDLDNDFTFVAIIYNPANSINRAFGFGQYPTIGRVTYLWNTGPVAQVELAATGGFPITTGITASQPGWHFVWTRRSVNNFYCGVDGTESAPQLKPAGSFAAADLTLGGIITSGSPVHGTTRFRVLAAWNSDLGTTYIAGLRTYLKTQWPGLP